MNASNEKQPATVKTLEKGLDVLNVLMRDIVHGYTPGRLVTETGLSNSDITRYVNALIKKGFAERSNDGKIRMNTRLAVVAVQIQHNLEMAKARIDETLYRITRTEQ